MKDEKVLQKMRARERLEEVMAGKTFSLSENQTRVLLEKMERCAYIPTPVIVPKGACVLRYLLPLQIFGKGYDAGKQAKLMEPWEDALIQTTERTVAIIFPRAIDVTSQDSRGLTILEHPAEIMAAVAGTKLLLVKNLGIRLAKKGQLNLELHWIPDEAAENHETLLWERDNSQMQVTPAGLDVCGTVVPLGEE